MRHGEPAGFGVTEKDKTMPFCSFPPTFGDRITLMWIVLVSKHLKCPHVTTGGRLWLWLVELLPYLRQGFCYLFVSSTHINNFAPILCKRSRTLCGARTVWGRDLVYTAHILGEKVKWTRPFLSIGEGEVYTAYVHSMVKHEGVHNRLWSAKQFT